MKLYPIFLSLLLTSSSIIAEQIPKVPKITKEFNVENSKTQAEFYGEPEKTNTSSPLNTIKTSCILQSDFKNKSQDQLKTIILTKVKAEAIDELYGSFMNTKIELRNGELINDEIQQASSGLVRIKGNAKYFNGENLGEICATITAYVTEADLKKYEKILIEAQSPQKKASNAPGENLFTENGLIAYFYDKDDNGLSNPLYKTIVKSNFDLTGHKFANSTLKKEKAYTVVLSGFIKSDSAKTLTLKTYADVYDFSLYVNDILISRSHGKKTDVTLKEGYNSIKLIAKTSESYDVAVYQINASNEAPLSLSDIYYDKSKIN
jgi:hypothetical protein